MWFIFFLLPLEQNWEFMELISQKTLNNWKRPKISCFCYLSIFSSSQLFVDIWEAVRAFIWLSDSVVIDCFDCEFAFLEFGMCRWFWDLLSLFCRWLFEALLKLHNSKSFRASKQIPEDIENFKSERDGAIIRSELKSETCSLCSFAWSFIFSPFITVVSAFFRLSRICQYVNASRFAAFINVSRLLEVSRDFEQYESFFIDVSDKCWWGSQRNISLLQRILNWGTVSYFRTKRSSLEGVTIELESRDI